MVDKDHQSEFNIEIYTNELIFLGKHSEKATGIMDKAAFPEVVWYKGQRNYGGILIILLHCKNKLFLSL